MIPEEAELLLPLVKKSGSKAAYLLAYAAPITRKMVPLFNDLTYYAVPSLPTDWNAPLWLRIELGIFAGRLYFDYHEYAHVLEFLGVKDETCKLEEEVEDDDDAADELNVEVVEGGDINKEKIILDVVCEEVSGEEEHNISLPENSIAVPVAVDRKPLTRRPLAFMAEWLSIRRKGQDIAETPMGFICAGKPLHENHPFFLRPEHERTRKEISSAQVGSGNADDEEDDEEKDVVVDNVYDNVYKEEDDEAVPQEVETKEDE